MSVASYQRAFVNCQHSSEKAAFPAPVVRDLGKDWIRAPTEANNGSYERRGEGRSIMQMSTLGASENLHLTLTTTNFHPK